MLARPTRERRRGSAELSRRAALAAVALSLLVPGCGWLEERREEEPVQIGPSPPTGGLDQDLSSGLSERFAEVSEHIRPTVVNIAAERVDRDRSNPLEQFFEEFLGRRPAPRPRVSLGSGVIVSPQGYILTNYHVVQQAEAIGIQLANGEFRQAEIVGLDEATDLGVVRVADDSLPAAELGDSDALMVGEWVLAVGNPFGVGQTVTAGIVSATERILGEGAYENFIQTDAAVNPGNSGGPLVNLRAQVVGINVGILSPTGVNLGIGFAIPSNLARGIMEELIEHGRVSRGWLGAVFQDLTPALARVLGLEAPRGALIAEIEGEDSPAGLSGLEAGDVVVEFGGAGVESGHQLGRMVAEKKPGERVGLKLYRGGELLSLDVELAERRNENAVGDRPSIQEPRDGERLGLTLDRIGAEESGATAGPGTGILVTGVEPGSPAERAGIEPGDVILEADREPMRNPDQLESRLERAPGGSDVFLRILRVIGDRPTQVWAALTVPERRTAR